MRSPCRPWTQRDLYGPLGPSGRRASEDLDAPWEEPGPRDDNGGRVGPCWRLVGRRADGTRLVLSGHATEAGALQRARLLREGGLEGYVELSVEAHNRPPSARLSL